VSGTWINSLTTTTYSQQKTANHVRDLLSKILSKKYPKVEDITETELLDWVMWPSFLGMLGKIEQM